MQNGQMKAPLMNSAVLEIQNDEVEECGFIARYNQVINAYNKYADEDEPQMEVIVGNPFVYKISEYLSKPFYLLGWVLVLVLIPLLNICCFGCILLYLIYLRRENKKHLRNLERVNDPFDHFYFMPEMCEQIGKHHATLNLQLNQIQGFTFNEKLQKKLSQKLTERKSVNSNQKFTVLIYDQHFYDSFHLYLKQFYKTLIWTISGAFLLTMSIIFYVSLFSSL